MRSSQESAQRLYERAEGQHGFFTARQAREAGYADSSHPYHVRMGNWIREHRGIYRLVRYPLPERPDLMLWQLWSHNRRGETQGTYSHVTALSLYGLSDAMPNRLDLTVPHGFQRMAAIPPVLRLHHADLDESDVEMRDGVRVTTPLRTLVDIVQEGALSSDLQAQATREALRRGLVVRGDLEQVVLSRRARRRLNAALAQAA